MPMALIISSYVAGSRVGGGIAPYVLGPLRIDPVHIPTTLLGRHPGWGAPGGGAVDAETMQGMLDGVAANGLYGRIDAILTGYFSSPDQIEVAARAIDDVRSVRGKGREPFVLVDPVMGDTGKGLFVAEETAAAQAAHLVPRADLVACNHWEFQHLNGKAATLEDCAEAAMGSKRNWMVSSIPFKSRLANLLVSGDLVHAAAVDIVPGPTPNGTGDLLRLAYVGQRLSGADETTSLHRAIGAVEMILQCALAWKAPELPLAACHAILSNPPEAGYVIAEPGDN